MILVLRCFSVIASPRTGDGGALHLFCYQQTGLYRDCQSPIRLLDVGILYIHNAFWYILLYIFTLLIDTKGGCVESR